MADNNYEAEEQQFTLAEDGNDAGGASADQEVALYTPFKQLKGIVLCLAKEEL